MDDPFLVADIGGTNARFALAEFDAAGVRLGDMHGFRAEDYETISDAAHAFLEAVQRKPKAACFAVAGPITDEVVEFTNSPWVLDIADVKKQLKLERLLAVNDFEALAASVRHLGPSDLAPVKPGKSEPDAPIVVMGPGTGLGQAIIVPMGGKDVIIATEGGHVAFAPQDDEEIDVLRFIMRDHSRVSIERLLSGRGLVNIHRALCAIAGEPRAPLQADEITRAAQTRVQPLAVKAVDLFCAILGSATGDAVLATGARGGVVLGGGVLPRIRDLFLNSRFVERFLDKGRMREYVEPVPVDLVIREGAALIGAASRLKSILDAN